MKGEIIRSSMIHFPAKGSLSPEWNCESLGKKVGQRGIYLAKTNPRMCTKIIFVLFPLLLTTL